MPELVIKYKIKIKNMGAVIHSQVNPYTVCVKSSDWCAVQKWLLPLCMFSLPLFPSPLLSLLILPQFSHYHFIKTINLRQVVLSAAFGYPATCQIPCPAAPAITYIYSHIYSLFIFCVHSPVCFFSHTSTHSQFHSAMFQTNWMHAHSQIQT